MSYLAAVVQLTSTADEEDNLSAVERLISDAAAHGAQLVATPENTNFLGPPGEKARRAQTLEGPVCTLFAEMARRLEIHLLLGSFNERARDRSRCYNTSVLFGPQGERLAVYRKIHLFDVDVGDKTRYSESATVIAGSDVVLADTSLGRLGLSICYDLRFPELYRRLRGGGAQVLFIPAAFTLTTGKDHWEPLIRTRAIDNQCYVVAPAQSGKHDDQGLRASWGHAMIVDPWGHVVARASDGPGLALAEVDLERVDRVRRSIPIEGQRRLD